MNAFSTKNFLAYESCMTSQSLDEAMESLHYDTGDGCKYHPVFVILLNCKTTFDKIAGKLVKGQMLLARSDFIRAIFIKCIFV